MTAVIRPPPGSPRALRDAQRKAPSCGGSGLLVCHAPQENASTTVRHAACPTCKGGTVPIPCPGCHHCAKTALPT